MLDLPTRQADLFHGRQEDRRTAAETVTAAGLAGLSEHGARACEEADLLAGASPPFDREPFLAGRQTPVFFGSELTNHGVEQFLHGFLALCSRPSGSRAGCSSERAAWSS